MTQEAVKWICAAIVLAAIIAIAVSVKRETSIPTLVNITTSVGPTSVTLPTIASWPKGEPLKMESGNHDVAITAQGDEKINGGPSFVLKARHEIVFVPAGEKNWASFHPVPVRGMK